jgi:hypothetical protein
LNLAAKRISTNDLTACNNATKDITSASPTDDLGTRQKMPVSSESFFETEAVLHTPYSFGNQGAQKPGSQEPSPLLLNSEPLNPMEPLDLNDNMNLLTQTLHQASLSPLTENGSDLQPSPIQAEAILSPSTAQLILPPPLMAEEKSLQPDITSDDTKSISNFSSLSTYPDQLAPKYVKSLRLSSDVLKSLPLVDGLNRIRFVAERGGACSCKLYKWPDNAQIVVSDIDGTITKSDVFGHLFTMIGKDWTQMGVAKLFTKIVDNGYRILYLTSRAIGQVILSAHG